MHLKNTTLKLLAAFVVSVGLCLASPAPKKLGAKSQVSSQFMETGDPPGPAGSNLDRCNKMAAAKASLDAKAAEYAKLLQEDIQQKGTCQNTNPLLQRTTGGGSANFGSLCEQFNLVTFFVFGLTNEDLVMSGLFNC